MDLPSGNVPDPNSLFAPGLTPLNIFLLGLAAGAVVRQLPKTRRANLALLALGAAAVYRMAGKVEFTPPGQIKALTTQTTPPSKLASAGSGSTGTSAGPAEDVTGEVVHG